MTCKRIVLPNLNNEIKCGLLPFCYIYHIHYRLLFKERVSFVPFLPREEKLCGKHGRLIISADFGMDMRSAEQVLLRSHSFQMKAAGVIRILMSPQVIAGIIINAAAISVPEIEPGAGQRTPPGI